VIYLTSPNALNVTTLSVLGTDACVQILSRPFSVLWRLKLRAVITPSGPEPPVECMCVFACNSTPLHSNALVSSTLPAAFETCLCSESLKSNSGQFTSHTTVTDAPQEAKHLCSGRHVILNTNNIFLGHIILSQNECEATDELLPPEAQHLHYSSGLGIRFCNYWNQLVMSFNLIKYFLI